MNTLVSTAAMCNSCSPSSGLDFIARNDSPRHTERQKHIFFHCPPFRVTGYSTARCFIETLTKLFHPFPIHGEGSMHGPS